MALTFLPSFVTMRSYYTDRIQVTNMTPLILALSLFTSLSFASTSREIVEEIFSKAAKPEIKKDARLQTELNNLVDYAHMAKEVLGAEFKKQKPQDIQWFEKMLKDIISLSVYPAAPDFLGKVNIVYKESPKENSKGNPKENKEEKDQSAISSIVKHKGEETEVNYRLHKQGENWKVYDVALDGESWTENIRTEVQKILKKEGWGGLKKRLIKRLDVLTQKNKS